MSSEIPRQLCTFAVGPHHFGINVDAVREVVRYGIYTPVPKAHPAIRGLMSLRGQVILTIDLRILLDLPAKPPADGRMPLNLVVHYGDQTLALVADQVGDVLNPEAKDFEATPETVRNPVRGLCAGVFKQTKGLLLLLDVQAAALRGATVA